MRRSSLGELGINLIEHAGKWDRLTDVFQSANPRNGPLDPHSKSRVRNTPEGSKVEIPLEGFLRQPMSGEPGLQHLPIMNALASADGFAIAFGSQDVHAQGKTRMFRIGLHVERLDRRRIAMDDHRAVKFLRKDRFLISAKIISVLDRIPTLL